MILRQKIIFFPILGGVRPPPQISSFFHPWSTSLAMQDAEYLNKEDFTNFYGHKTLNLLYSRLAHSIVNTWRTRQCTVYMKEYAPVIYKVYPFVSTHTYVRNKKVHRKYPSYYRNVYDLINQKLYRVTNTTRDCRPSIFWSDRHK
jgi:hypothetical protein